MNMKERAFAAKLSNRRNRIYPLPPKVRRIKVGPDPVANCAAKFQQRIVRIANKPRMHLNREVDLVLLEQLVLLFPIRNHDRVPLPSEDVAILIGPSASHPVRIHCLWPVAGTAAE